MFYSVEQSDAVANQLERLAAGHIHHLVGHYANVKFWLSEVRHALDVLDGYEQRFQLLHAAQTKWIEDHGTVVNDPCPICQGACEFGPRKPGLPTRVDAKERNSAKQRLRDASYHFLLRCHRAGFLDRNGLRQACRSVGTSMDLGDLA